MYFERADCTSQIGPLLTGGSGTMLRIFEISGDEGGLNENSQDENFCYFSYPAGVVSSLLHSHCAVRFEDGVSRKGLPPRLLYKSFTLKQQDENREHVRASTADDTKTYHLRRSSD